MDNDRLKAELAAKRDAGAVMRRLRSLREAASRLTGGGVPAPLRRILEQAYEAPVHSRLGVVAREQRELGAQLKNLAANDWRSAIATMLPHVAPSAEAACDLLTTGPTRWASPGGRSGRRAPCPRWRTSAAAGCSTSR